MSNRELLLAVVILLIAGIASADQSSEVQKQSMTTFRKNVQPLLQELCANCHGAKKQAAKLRLDKLNPDMAADNDGETWHDVLNKLNQGDMPPEKSTQPTAQEREILVSWMTTELKRAIAVKRSTGGRVVMRRLTRYEYANTMRDLLGVRLDFAKDLPADPNSPDGLANNGTSLNMSPLQIEHYLQTARVALGKAIVTGERPQVYRSENKGDQLNREGFGQGSERQVPSGGIMTFRNYPHAGEFLIEVQLSSNAKTDMPIPVMGVYMGKRASPNNFQIKLVGEVDITGPVGEPQTYTVRGRMEDFPLIDPTTPLKEQRNPGLRIGFHDSYRPEFGARNQRQKKGKNATKKPAPKEPQGFTIHRVKFEAPIIEQWPPRHHTNILFPAKLRETNEREYARQVIERFMRRAFRRPIEAKEVEPLLSVYDELRPAIPSLELTMREVLMEVLVTPDFLYLLEPTEDQSERQQLTDYELASRLSYFLWSTMPNKTLFELAQKGLLHDAKPLEQQTREMLQDNRSWNFVENFTDQWLDLAGLNRLAVNPDFYPDFDNELKTHMRHETQHFFAELLHKQLSAMNLLDSEFAMLNRPLAKHYGITGPPANGFVRVTLKPEHRRGGLLGQASILLRNSNGEDSHPIYRGAWIKDRLLGDPPASPPPDVPDLEKDNPKFKTLSLKKQLELHRHKASCNSCHRHIDPWGIPLENFDAVGVWRTERRRPAETPANRKKVRRIKGKQRKPPNAESQVEVTSTLPGEHQINGFKELKQHLLTHERKRFTHAFVRRMLAFSVGRSLELSDQPTIDSLLIKFEASDYHIDELIVAITQSDVFRMK